MWPIGHNRLLQVPPLLLDLSADSEESYAVDLEELATRFVFHTRKLASADGDYSITGAFERRIALRHPLDAHQPAIDCIRVLILIAEFILFVMLARWHTVCHTDRPHCGRPYRPARGPLCLLNAIKRKMK